MVRPHVVVVGAGISGLAAALLLSGDSRVPVRVTVVEAAHEVGGKLRLAEVAGLPVDVGAESMLSRRPEAIELAREVGLADDVVSPDTTRASVVSRGRLRPFPARTAMGVPGDLAELARSRVLSRHAMARIPLDHLLPGAPLQDDVSVAAFVGRRLGREVVDRLVDPLLGGVYAGHPSRLSFAATMGPLVPQARRFRSLLDAAAATVGPPAPSGTAPPFVGLQGGVGSLAAACRVALLERAVELRTGLAVRGLARGAHGWTLTCGSAAAPTALTADAVVLAIPAAPAARLLVGIDSYAAREIDSVEYASVAVVSLAFPSQAVPASLVGSGYLVPAVEGGLVKAVTWSSNKWAWLRRARPSLVLARASLGRHGEQRALQLSDPELAQQVMDEISARVGVRGSPIDVVVTRWGGALPQYAVGHLQRVQRVREALARVSPPVEACGAALDGVGIAACVAAGAGAAQRVLQRLDTDATMTS